MDALSAGRHTFGSAATRRQAANRPAGPFTPTLAARPGEQVQIDSTPLDVMVVLDDGVTGRADLTIAVDVATRTICAAVLRPVGTKAVDAALLLARMLVPEPMRPGWAAGAGDVGVACCRTPGWLSIDARMEHAAARPVIVPDTIVIDGGKVFVSDTFIRPAAGWASRSSRPGPGPRPTRGSWSATFGSVNTLFCQHVAGYTGSERHPARRLRCRQAAWTVPDLQDLLDEWLIVLAEPAARRRCATRSCPAGRLSPNEKYAALVAAAGYLPVPCRARTTSSCCR